MKITHLTTALLLTASTLSHGAVLVDNAWVRAMPPSQTMTAGYAKLTNTGPAPVTIDGGSSPIATTTELHTTIKEGDQRRMVPLAPVTIPPGESFLFTPGGPHVMLMGVTAMPGEGSTTTLCFTVVDGEAVCSNAQVQRSMGAGHHHH